MLKSTEERLSILESQHTSRRGVEGARGNIFRNYGWRARP
jgi:hypothetical protein